MFNKKLSHGLVVELAVLEGPHIGTYKTRVEEVGERLITVGAPFLQGHVIPLREGTRLKLTFWDETAAYSFEAKIMQRIAVPIPLFVLELPDSVAKVQRRCFVRVPALFSIAFRMVTREGISDLYKGTLLDLSGGGMRFLTGERVDNNSLIYTQLSLPNGDLSISALVHRVERLEDIKRYSVSAEFHDIAERERDKIIRCVFEIQRALRKKGMV